jgi:hypothetical protein
VIGRHEVVRANPRHATSTLSYHSCHSDAERGGGICDTTSPEKWSDCAEKQVRSPLPPVHDFQPYPASTQPQPCLIILVIPTPNAAEESATLRHAKNGVIARKACVRPPVSSSGFSAPPGAHATSTLPYHSCHSDAERGGGICDTTSPEKWRDYAEEQVRSPLPPVHDFQPHPASTQPQPCLIILVIPTPNAAEESATPRHAKSGIASSPCKHDRAAVGVICMHNGVFCTSQRLTSI